MPEPATRRQLFLFVTLATLSAFASSAWAEAPQPQVEDGVAWYDVQDWGVEGKGWDDVVRYYDRLPSRAEEKVRGAVWSLSRHSAGMLTRFTTDATTIHVRYKLMSNRLDMPHMPATGVSGVDLYARDEAGHDRWLAVSRPGAQQVNAELVSGIDPRPNGEPRLYTLYLPLYNGVDQLEIGVPEGSKFTAVAPRDEKPIVFYGTSIMHGACASRPGMSISGIVGRRMNCPVINLGFSGNGRLEAEVGEFLTELDPAVFVIDCLPNVGHETIAEKTEPLVMQLRKSHPDTPILLVEDRSNTSSPFKKAHRDRHETSRAAFKLAYENLQAAGVKNLYYLPGEDLLGDDGEAATDGSHPSDLGMVRYADAYVPALQEILGKN
ncbi:SGNH/GDSL hydrolase family protein [Blastopirellula retiformator]|uniref:SGNH hydrolase-type esterase domain-containing protein n=1 Tax=Blastopirellula retiformator TaxID=2527970 RepID=A0A5C5USR5_9BACT|nr:SGNH/GDSL hydrolase family protein [Blastopirellula retiformator]TWT29424.1 hypothetical protein Enr8_49400 [Blastopirellula retiformator]